MESLVVKSPILGVAVNGELEVKAKVEFGRGFTLDLVEHDFHTGILEEFVGGLGVGLACGRVECLEYLRVALLGQVGPRVLEETAGGLGHLLPK